MLGLLVWLGGNVGLPAGAAVGLIICDGNGVGLSTEMGTLLGCCVVEVVGD